LLRLVLQVMRELRRQHALSQLLLQCKRSIMDVYPTQL